MKETREFIPTIDHLKNNPKLVRDELAKLDGQGSEVAAAIGNLLGILNHEPTTHALLRTLEDNDHAEMTPKEKAELKGHASAIRKEIRATRSQLYPR